PRSRSGLITSARPSMFVTSLGTSTTSPAVIPSRPSARIPAKPRVVGASGGAEKNTRVGEAGPVPSTSTCRKIGDWHSGTGSSSPGWSARRSGSSGRLSLNSMRSCTRSEAPRSLKSWTIWLKASGNATMAPHVGDSVPPAAPLFAAGFFSDRDGHAYRVAPFGPRTIVVANILPPQQVGEHEPGVGGALPDAAVRDDRFARVESLFGRVEALEFLAGSERAVLVRRLRPGHRFRARDVPAAQRSFLRVVGHVGAFAGVFGEGADVDELPAEE